jgi:hypothetical protein
VRHARLIPGLIGAVIAAALLIAFVFLDPVAALRGWLATFVWATMAPVGALALLLIHRITGGKWGDELAPVLEATAQAILPAAIFVLPVLAFSGFIYRWEDPEMPANVRSAYMNPLLFGVRSVIALMLWSLLAWVPALRNSPARAGASLVVLSVITNIIPVDWIVSTQPGFYSSGFGFGFGIEKMLAALALAALLGPQGDDHRESRDLAGLIIATLLGVIYFMYMQFTIIWYGNIPQKAAWYVIRGRFPWPQVGAVAFTLGAVLPFAALLTTTVRESHVALRVIGASMSVAIALHLVWLIVPSFGIAALAPAIAGIAMAGFLFAIWLRWKRIIWFRRGGKTKTAAQHAC